MSSETIKINWNCRHTWRKSSKLAKPLALSKFVSLIIRQFALPMEKTEAVRYG